MGQFLQMIPDNKEFLFQFLGMLPVPVEVFAPDGTAIFLNRAYLDLNNIPDADLIVGKYNLLNDPVCNDKMGLRESIEKAFRGEAVVAHDVSAPIEDLVERGIIDEKPYEKSIMDFYLYPVKNNDELAFVVFICIVKNLYHGKPDIARAKEYIESHWQGCYIPEELAKSLNISVAQLYKLFKEHSGMTPGDYHKKIKLEHIKEKLADNNMSIKEAFAACGEDSRGWMLRVFKDSTGMTPTEYRRKNSV